MKGSLGVVLLWGGVDEGNITTGTGMIAWRHVGVGGHEKRVSTLLLHLKLLVHLDHVGFLVVTVAQVIVVLRSHETMCRAHIRVMGVEAVSRLVPFSHSAGFLRMLCSKRRAQSTLFSCTEPIFLELLLLERRIVNWFVRAHHLV